MSSIALVIEHAELSAETLLTKLRSLTTPVIGRIKEDKVWLDMRGADPFDELEVILEELN